MGTPGSASSPSTDFYGIFGFPKTASKAYKLFVNKLHPDKKPSHNHDFNKHSQQDEKSTFNESPTTKEDFVLRSVDDSNVYKRRSSLLSRSGSRRSHTPQARPTYLSSSSSRKNTKFSTFSPPSTRPTSTSRREKDDASRRSQREKENNVRLIQGATSFTPLSRSGSRRDKDKDDSRHLKGGGMPSTTTPLSKSTSLGEAEGPKMVRNMSRRSTTPIIFSHSIARKKPSPVERKLECTLEELCHGGVKNIKISRDVISDEGIIVQEEETLRINIKPGWKRGTKITFEGKGNEKPGYLPADIIFVVAEKKHALFKRREDDLEIAVEIPLLKALNGCTLSVPLLGGEKMALSIDDIIYPGFEKAIPGQGMPVANEDGKRGALKITFLVKFPDKLSEEKRAVAFDVLKDCSWS